MCPCGNHLACSVFKSCNRRGEDTLPLRWHMQPVIFLPLCSPPGLWDCTLVVPSFALSALPHISGSRDSGCSSRFKIWFALVIEICEMSSWNESNHCVKSPCWRLTLLVANGTFSTMWRKGYDVQKFSYHLSQLLWSLLEIFLESCNKSCFETGT